MDESRSRAHVAIVWAITALVILTALATLSYDVITGQSPDTDQLVTSRRHHAASVP